MNASFILAFETLMLFFLPPLLIMLGYLPINLIMPILWLGTLYGYLRMRQAKAFSLKFHYSATEMLSILKRFALLAPILGVLTWLVFPQWLFYFALEQPKFWLAVMLLYPILSAFTQEILFRAFFEYRFAHVIKSPYLYLFFNATLFAYVHLLFENAIAVVLSFIGSILFMQSYQKSRSVLMSAIEHGLYGNLIYTLGLGHFFYHGA